jgi:hypothetical protein
MCIYGIFIERGIGPMLAEGAFNPRLLAQITLPFMLAGR